MLAAALLAALAPGSGAAPELIALETPDLVVESYRIPDTTEVCRAGGSLEFTLTRPATVSLDLEGKPARAVLDGKATVFTEASLDAGPHRAYVLPDEVRTTKLSAASFVLRARTPDGHLEERTGQARDEILNRAVLPVGHTFVQGVDLLDAHLTLQATDMKLGGRHLALEVTRTYSSAGPASRSPMGAGWAMNYDGSVSALEACALMVVRTADGGSQSFRPGPLGALVPQRGYHTELRRNRDGSYDFTDKSATRHHFDAPVVRGSPSLRLAYIEDPHGDRIVLGYDELGRLARADEWQAGVGPMRTLLFEYRKLAGAWRICGVHGSGLGLNVRYRYDRHGNLVVANRSDIEVPGFSWTDRYEYSVDSARDPHQLVATLPAGKPRTDYRYFGASDELPGDGPHAEGPLAWGGKQEFVKAVEQAAASESVGFAFDHTGAAQGLYRAEVRAFGGDVTRYRLNGDGNPLVIDEPTPPGRTVWRMEWDPRHVVKVRQTNDHGRMAEYGHDERGNLTSDRERQTTTGPIQTTLYTYDPRFNKLTSQQDPSGALTRYEIDPQTGDLTRKVEADGKVTRYAYTPQGCLAAQVGDGGRTVYAGQDSFCQATLVTASDGKETRFRYDARGRRRDGHAEATPASASATNPR